MCTPTILFLFEYVTYGTWAEPDTLRYRLTLSGVINVRCCFTPLWAFPQSYCGLNGLLDRQHKQTRPHVKHCEPRTPFPTPTTNTHTQDGCSCEVNSNTQAACARCGLYIRRIKYRNDNRYFMFYFTFAVSFVSSDIQIMLENLSQNRSTKLNSLFEGVKPFHLFFPWRTHSQNKGVKRYCKRQIDW